MENLQKRPSKGILKTSSSIERQDSKLMRQNSHDKELKWDEMNVLATLHPADKDYGHMKIEEPKTPYSYYAEDDDIEANSDTEAPKEIDPDSLAEKLKAKNAFSFNEADIAEKFEDCDDEDLGELTEEEREKRKDFESKRKKHYNEYQMVKLARKLMEDEQQEEEEDDDSSNTAATSSSAPSAEPVPSTSTDQGEDISKA